MLNKKFFGLLLVPIMVSSMNMSYAVSETASQTIQGILAPFIDIQPETNGIVTSTNINPDNGALAENLISKFRIRTNGPSQEIYLKATTESLTNRNENAFFVNGGKTYVILANTTSKPSRESISDCKNLTPTTNLNSDSIAYPIENIVLDNQGTATFDEAKVQYNVNINTGETIATTTVGTEALLNTYSYEDKAGTYQAILTLSTTSL